MIKNQYPIQIIEDDIALAQSLQTLLSAFDYTSTHYKSAEEFLLTIRTQPQAMSLPTCVICDIRLPKLSGIDAYSKLLKENPDCVWSFIFVTGHADVNMAVDAMRRGAFDFLSKPFDPHELPNKLHLGIEQSCQLAKEMEFVHDFKQRTSTLTQQETHIFELMLKNLTSKEIAEQLGNSPRTIEIHRAAIFKKMRTPSILELGKQTERFELYISHRNL